MENENKRIALLIDGDNAQPKFIESILSEAGKYGKVTIRRMYGDWTSNRLNGWKENITKYAIKPMQKFAFAAGKNSSDTAMIIDAMDILHSKSVTGFCIASSDSDYTGLAQRIREEGVFFMGVGEAGKTSDAFVNACDIFVFTENLVSTIEPAKKNEKEVADVKKKTVQTVKVDAPILPDIKLTGKIELPQNRITKEPIDLKMLINAFIMVRDDNGLAYMGEIGRVLRNIDPSFDSRTFGFQTTSALFKSLSEVFETVYKDNGTSLYIKLKK